MSSQEFPEESLQDLPAVSTAPRPRRRLNKNKIAGVIVLIGLFAVALVVAAKVQTNNHSKVDLALSKASSAIYAIGEIGTRVDGLEYKIATLEGRADTNVQRVDKIEDRLGTRVKAENQQYKRMLSYIRGANPGCDLARKKDAEVEKLLNNGVWDIEGKIQAEYNRLVANTANSAAERANKARTAADVAQVVADGARKTADKAVAAGETALDGLGAIAEQKGRSVTPMTKAEINEKLKAYWRQYDAVIKEGAPEE